MTELKTLKDTVQKNCDISDARYAGNYSMCVFLLKMREYFRWEQGFRLSEPLPGKALGDWLQARERLWETLGEQTFQPLAVEGQELDAFAADAINDRLAARGLVYSAGYGRYCKPHFFMALRKASC